ncbi:MAG: DUF3095 domain-containing protein [Planctomycetota bacterium]|nr:MAG: DUF3095 domain-containing protein [Planctomycetota bacterium]
MVESPKQWRYQDIPAFTDIRQVTQSQWFHPLPSDWTVFISDVRGSTRAIEAGRYKDVNTLGAASIAAVSNALGHLDFPFVFGGDGASMALPPQDADRARRALLGLGRLAADNFSLDLRVAAVPAAMLHGEGFSLEVGRFQVVPGRCIAVFRGGGLSAAEDLIKQEEERFACAGEDALEANLGGLSCRWREIPGSQGCVLSILLVARPRESVTVYNEFFALLDDSLGGIGGANPLALERMQYHSMAELIRNERQFHHRLWSWRWWARRAEIMAAVAIFRWGVHPLFFSPRRYANSMRIHADYCKFDDMLRMVIDCSPEQAQCIEDWLQKAYAHNRVYYGLHRSPGSLMTCFVQGMGDGSHLHFIDGSQGGYAMAAKELKQQFHDSLSHPHRPAVHSDQFHKVIDHA